MGKGRGERSYVGRVGFFLDYSTMLLGILCLVQISTTDQWSGSKASLEIRSHALENRETYRRWKDVADSNTFEAEAHALRASMCWTVFTGMFTVASLSLMILQVAVTLPNKLLAVIYFLLSAGWIFLGLVLALVIYNAYGYDIAVQDVPNRNGYGRAAYSSAGGRFSNTLWMATLYLFSALWNLNSSDQVEG